MKGLNLKQLLLQSDRKSEENQDLVSDTRSVSSLNQ